MRKFIYPLLCVVILASVFAASLAGCGDKTTVNIPAPIGSAGDPLEVDYNITFGAVGIPSGGTVAVTHGLGATPSAVLVQYSLPYVAGGSAVVASVTDVGLTTFIINLRRVGPSGTTTATSGSVMYAATIE